MNNMLSACLIVKDEEPCIEKCLASVKSYVNEIVVVDTGSTDNTVQLAKKFTDKVLDFKWINDFSAARNFSIKNAKHDWIFVLDADHQVQKWNENTVRKFIGQNDPRQVGNVEIISTFEDGSIVKKSSERENKLFNRKHFCFDGTIHEQLAALDGSGFGRTDVDITLLHSGYNHDEIIRKDKAARNISMLKQAIEQKGDDCYLFFQLGKAYEMEKDLYSARECYLKAINLIDNFEYLYVRKLIISYGYTLVNEPDYKEALIIEKYKNYYDSNPDFNFLLAYIYMMNGQLSNALETFFKCTAEAGGEIEGITTWLPFYNIGVIYECLGKFKEALKYYSKCGNYEQARNRLNVLLSNNY